MAHLDERTETAGSEQRGGLDREILLLGAVVVLGTIMTILDVTIVNVAVPTLGAEYGTSIATIQWVLTGYMLAFASVIPLAGWATERFGAKHVWLASLGLFMLGSALAAAAWSIGSLIACRVIQGLGAGTILPVGQTMLAQAAGPQRMGRVMSVIGVPMLLGPILGPVIGGAIVDQVSWRWIFLVNLPVGALALVLAHRLLPDAQPRLGQRLDLRGLALLSPGIAVLLYGVSEAGSEGGFSNARTVVATLVGVALVAGFVWHAIGAGKDALIDLTLFTRRGFAVAAATNFVLGLALFGALILLPLYYQLVRRESPLDTGLLLAPQGLGAAVAMPLAGSLTDRHGARRVVPAGMVVALLGTLAFLAVGADTSYALLSVALFLIGAGLGSTIMPSMAVAFTSISRDAVPRASSALNAIQRIAGAIGTAMFAIVLQRQIENGVPSLQGGIGELARLRPAAQARLAPALADAFGQTFWLAVVLILVALVPALLLPRPEQDAQDEGATAPSAERRAA
jgi:EmrB/QacA subfamily drug resistance transporter